MLLSWWISFLWPAEKAPSPPTIAPELTRGDLKEIQDGFTTQLVYLEAILVWSTIPLDTDLGKIK